jgi:glycosyltransferase involved in cell wall biosynthesis
MTGRINILQVYYEPSMSGITRHVGMIIEGLKHDSAVSFHVLCSTDDPRIPEYFRSLHIPVVSVPGAKYFSIKGLWKVLCMVRKHKISLVHIHNLQSLFWANLPKIGTPRTLYIFTPHIINFENKWIERVFYFVWRFFACLTDKIVSLSEIQRTSLATQRIKKKKALPVIPNSLPLSDDLLKENVLEKENPLEIQNPCIVSVIRLVPQKRPFEILSIAREICARFRDVTFYLVGDGPLSSELSKRIREEGLTQRVIMTGFRSDALRIISRADIVLSASLWEGLPYTLLEAMYCKKPILASDIEGHRPLILDGLTGYLASSPLEYVDKITHLLENPDLKKEMGEAARKHFDQNFTFDLFLTKIKAIYNINK